jgi:hypothetical protein
MGCSRQDLHDSCNQRRWLVGALAIAVLAISGCGQDLNGAPRRSEATAPAPAAKAPAAVPAPAVARLTAGPTCQATGSHDAHTAVAVTCAACHACAGVVAFGPFTFPGGTSTAGGTLTQANGTTTCTVACHFPLGATPHTVTWGSGPLACTSCHTNGGGSGTNPIVSSHPGLGTGSNAACTNCHDMSAHTSGQVKFVNSGGTTVDGTCAGCHSGSGSTLSGFTPPLLWGWTTPVLDFHGPRAGVGYGGTLLPPYVRGQAAISCVACHDAHSSANAFLLAGQVNGATIPPSTIGRAGIGAEKACEGCHAGARHGTCAGCHGADPMPAGSPCLVCHGHEGIRSFFTYPSGLPGDYHAPVGPANACDHCHGAWMPQAPYLPPVILSTGRVTVSSTTNTGATLVWDTDRPATSFVEFGVSTPRGFVQGDGNLVKSHSVTLTGLTAGTTYSYRVRTSDAGRNDTYSAVGNFTTSCPSCLSPPVLVPQYFWQSADYFPWPITFQWGAVVNPDRDPVQYRVQVSQAADFSTITTDSGWIPAVSWTGSMPAEATYYWRVMSRDAVHTALQSAWSAPNSFFLQLWVPPSE